MQQFLTFLLKFPAQLLEKHIYLCNNFQLMQQFFNFHIRSFFRFDVPLFFFFFWGGGGRDGDTFKTSFPLRTTFAFTHPQCKDVFWNDSFRPHHNTKVLLPIKSLQNWIFVPSNLVQGEFLHCA